MEQVLLYFSRDLDELAPEPAIRSFDTGQRIHCNKIVLCLNVIMIAFFPRNIQ